MRLLTGNDFVISFVIIPFFFNGCFKLLLR